MTEHIHSYYGLGDKVTRRPRCQSETVGKSCHMKIHLAFVCKMFPREARLVTLIRYPHDRQSL